MKFATFRHEGSSRVGVVDAERGVIIRLQEQVDAPVGEMLTVIRSYEQLRGRIRPGGHALPLDRVKLEAPLPRPPRNVFCVGKNYREHAHEFARSGFDSSAKSAADAIPTAPIVFTKAPETVIASGEDIRYPEGVSDQLDYEAELGVVIGVGGRGIKREHALRHVFGYTIINDVTARDLQARHKQWFIGKSLDTFCPMGPWLVTADEVDVANLELRCWVNEDLRQSANTSDFIFDVPTLIETLSAGLTLQPGDVISTGTPKGVGLGFDPPRFLQRGDQVRIEISGIGTLINRVA